VSWSCGLAILAWSVGESFHWFHRNFANDGGPLDNRAHIAGT